MKRLLITLLAAVLASGAFAQSFPDVPANHWAGDAVERLADLGVIIGFPDGTFRGNEAFTRYQSALVASRLIDVLGAEMNAALALTRADIESLRNALQEVASDVAAQGVRLSAAESAIAGLSDDVTGNSARLDALEAAMASGTGGVDPAVLRDLQNQIASQRVAIDTAQAQADAAAARADDAYGLANQALAMGRQNAADIAAINRVLQLMSSDIAELQAGSGGAVTGGTVDLSGVESDIERNRADIANLREFAILLRREQVGMRDQVAALQAASDEQQGQIDDLTARVQALETNPYGISGTISIDYFVGRVDGDPFDIDRAYGLNNDRNMGASVFSSGAVDLDGDATTSSGYRTEVGEVAQDRHDIEQTSGAATASLSLSLTKAFGFDGTGSPRGLNSFSAVVRIDMHTQTIGGPLGSGGSAPLTLFHVHSFTTTFSPIGAAPLTFAFGTNVKATFTPYIVSTDDNGFIATVTSPPFLAFLDPTLTVVYTTPAVDEYLRAARLTLSPLEGVTIGASFAQHAENAEDFQDVDADNFTRTVYGVDGTVSLSIFDLGFAWANGSDGTNSDSILYATLGVDGENLPILNSLQANYRAMGDQWDALGFNMGSSSNRPFAIDQTGFGALLSLGVSIIDVTGYFDSYTITAGDSAQAFGVDLEADLFRAISLHGWYHQASVNGAAVDSLTAAGVNRSSAHRPSNDTSFGVELDHDGSADNALISGLNINAGYMQDTADFSRTTIWADADMELTVSIVTLTPYVGFRSVNDSDAGTDDTTTIKVGTGLVTTPLNVFTQPSLMAAVNYRTTSHSDLATYTATELQWSVGLVLNEFIFENSSLTAKYGSWTGTNVRNFNTNAATHPDPNDFASDISAGDVNNGVTQSTSGFEFIWDYWDLVFAYGVYQNDNGGVTSSAQAFSIAYEVDF